MWPAIVFVVFIVFLAGLVFLWKVTPESKFDYKELGSDFPKWFIGIVIVVSIIFRPKGKNFLIATIAVSGFAAIAAIYGQSVIQAVLDWWLNKPPAVPPAGKPMPAPPG